MSAVALEPPSPEGALRQSILDLLWLAVSLCDARFAVARIGGVAITTDDAAPLDQDAVVAAIALNTSDPIVTSGAHAAVKLMDSRGQLWGTMSVGGVRFHDTSQRLIGLGRQMARLLELNLAALEWKEQADLFSALVEEAMVAVYSIRNGRFSYVNQRFADALGYSKEELLSLKSFTDIVAEEQRDRVREFVRSRQDGEHREVQYVTEIRSRDGRTMQAEIHGSVADMEGDRVVIGVALDVTARENALKKIREQEEFLRVLTDNIADVLLIVDANRNLAYVSGSIKNVLGYEVAERQGKKAFETVHPDDRPALDDRLKAFAESGRFDRAAYRFRHKNGSWRILELSGTNLLDHPQIRGWLITASDITERRRLEQELEQLNRLTSLGRLSAQVAHEFNNVMMGIQTPVELMCRRTAEDPQMSRFAEMITSSIARGKRITSDILRFARPAQAALRSVDVQELVRKSAEEIKLLLPEKTKLELDLRAAPLHIHADPSQLSQVLINLSLNARDAMNGRGTLTIGARPGAEHTARSVADLPNAHEFVHISVSDTGEGISSDDLPYIFEPLFTTKRTGTGLGLSVVYQVITGHGGHVFVDSRRGEGTTFHLFIPKAIESQATSVETPEKKAMLEPKIRILIVEDEVAIATGLRWILEAEGMTVHVVGTAAEVHPAIEEFEPDVMVLDLSLPDGDGRAVYEEIDQPIPVIFSTGSLGEKDLLESGHGHVAILRKPYATDELLRMIHQVLSGGGHDA